ncbi:unnamed protein product [Amoebophrya sp. A120]|nr:unnamed protein product [Amoebophrya sp. A120]|eukprot:GSA120T00002359001.1
MDFDKCVAILQARQTEQSCDHDHGDKAADDCPAINVDNEPEDAGVAAAIEHINRQTANLDLVDDGGLFSTSATATAKASSTYGEVVPHNDSISANDPQQRGDVEMTSDQLLSNQQDVRDAMDCIFDETWESGIHDLSLVRQVLRVQDRRVQIQKAFDLVLRKLIAKREVHAGYKKLTLDVTSAFQDVNAHLRRCSDQSDNTRFVMGTPQYEEATELRKAILGLLDLEKSKFEKVAAFHVAQIRLYTSSLQTGSGNLQQSDTSEHARRMHYQEVADLKRGIQAVEEDIQDALVELRYGFN